MSSGESMRNPNKLVGLRVSFGLCGIPDTDTDADEDDDISHHSVAPRSPEDFFYPRRDKSPLDGRNLLCTIPYVSWHAFTTNGAYHS